MNTTYDTLFVVLLCLFHLAQLPLQPSPFQPPCLEIQTTASANSTANITSVMIPRSVIFIPRFLSYSFLPSSIHDLQAKSNSLPHIFCAGAAGAAALRECCTPGARQGVFAGKESVSKKVKVF